MKRKKNYSKRHKDKKEEQIRKGFFQEGEKLGDDLDITTVSTNLQKTVADNDAVCVKVTS